jgi:predicted nucleotidyltransferase component of viral defense system
MYQKKSFKKTLVVTTIFLAIFLPIQYASAQTINVDLDLQDPQETTINQEDIIQITDENKEFSIKVHKINGKSVTFILNKTNTYITTSFGKKSTINFEGDETSDIAVTVIEIIDTE